MSSIVIALLVNKKLITAILSPCTLKDIFGQPVLNLSDAIFPFGLRRGIAEMKTKKTNESWRSIYRNFEFIRKTTQIGYF